MFWCFCVVVVCFFVVCFCGVFGFGLGVVFFFFLLFGWFVFLCKEMAVLSEQLRLGESEMKKTVISLLAFAVTSGTAWADTAPTHTGKDNRVAAREF